MVPVTLAASCAAPVLADTVATTESADPSTIGVDGSGMAISFGFGAGVNFNNRMSIETEYASLEADIGYGSVALNGVL